MLEPSGLRLSPRPDRQDFVLVVGLSALTAFWTAMVGWRIAIWAPEAAWFCMVPMVPFLWAITLLVAHGVTERRDLEVTPREVVVRRRIPGRSRVHRLPLAGLVLEPWCYEGSKRGSLLMGVALRSGDAVVKFELPGARAFPEHDRARRELAWVVEQLERARDGAVADPEGAEATMREALSDVTR